MRFPWTDILADRRSASWPPPIRRRLGAMVPHRRPSGRGVRARLALLALLLCAGAPPSASAARRAPAPAWPQLPPAGPADRILVVAPHVDDEAIAAAGYLA